MYKEYLNDDQIDRINKLKRYIDLLENNKSDDLILHFEKSISIYDEIDIKYVTPSYILEQRQKHVYPTVIFNIDSEYGGYHSGHLEHYTRNQFKVIRNEVDKLYDSI